MRRASLMGEEFSRSPRPLGRGWKRRRGARWRRLPMLRQQPPRANPRRSPRPRHPRPRRPPAAIATRSSAACAGAASAPRAAAIDRRGRQRCAAARVLLRHHRRRPLEDDQRRHDLDADCRQDAEDILGRRRRLSPSNPDVVYIGMGESQLRGNIIQGDGVYKTADGGKTWTHWGSRKPWCFADPRASDQSGHGVRGGARQPVRVDAGSWRVPLARWRQDLGSRAVPRRRPARPIW